MPIELKPKTSTNEAAPEETQGLMLFNEDGELTLAGETVADFLSSADFSAVVESEHAAPFLSNPAVTDEDPYATDEDEEDLDGEDVEGDEDEESAADESTDEDEEAEIALPGAVAARLVDESDLVDMFGYYLDQLAERKEPTLQEQATLAVFENLRGAEGGIDEDSREEVAALLLNVLSEGLVYGDIDALDERIMSKAQRRKATKIRSRPKSGKRRADLKKRKREEGRGSKKAKITRQHKQRSRRKASRIRQLARENVEGTLVFGLGEGINGALLRISLAESPNMDFTDEQLVEFDEMCGNIVECPDEDCDHTATFAAFIIEAKKAKKKKKKMDKDGDDDDSDEDEKSESRDGECPDCGCVVENMLDEKGKVPPAFLKNMKKKKGEKDDDESDDKDEKGKKEKKKDESIVSMNAPGVFSIAAGRPNLSEGHSLAAATLGVLGRAKPVLTEDKD